MRIAIVAALLVFVAGSVAYRLTRGSDPDTPVAAADSQAASRDGVVVYYFHGNVRCATCRRIEAYAHEALTTGFERELKRGTLIWRPTNVETPGNGHFVEDFRLTTRSVVVAEMRDGATLRWQVLDEVWQVVGDKAEFLAYIRDEVRRFIGGGGV